MPTASPARSAPSPLMRGVSVLTTLALGCATVRAPASTIPDAVPIRGGVAEPQLELWLESGRSISPAEAAEATAQARAALQAALSRVSAPRGDAILVVRAQGVARTASRRADQHAAIAGIVVGAVVIVAAVVVVLVASKGKGGGGGLPRLGSAPRAAPRPPAFAVRPAPPPGRIPVPLPQPGFRAPRAPGAHVDVDVAVDVNGSPPPEEAPYAYPAPEPGADWGPQPPTSAWTERGGVLAIALPPPPPLDPSRRGFFEGDTLRLELVVVDRRDGAPLWTKTVDRDVDPRDAAAVERLLGEAIADGVGWLPARG